MPDLGAVGRLADVTRGAPPVAPPDGGIAFAAPVRTVISVSAVLAQPVPPAPGPAGDRFASATFSNRFSAS